MMGMIWVWKRKYLIHPNITLNEIMLHKVSMKWKTLIEMATLSDHQSITPLYATVFLVPENVDGLSDDWITCM
jgi:hypothetical protein